jgi:hypothetical protein
LLLDTFLYFWHKTKTEFALQQPPHKMATLPFMMPGLPLPVLEVTLMTGECILVTFGSGHPWYLDSEQHAGHLNRLNLWDHTLRWHNQHEFSPLWKMLHSRLGYANLQSSVFEKVYEKHIHWALSTPLCCDLRMLEALDLGNNSANLTSLEHYSNNNQLRPFGEPRPIIRPSTHIGKPIAYKTTFVSGDLNKSRPSF